MFQIYIYNVKCCSYRRLVDINETEMQPINFTKVPYEEERQGLLNPLLHLIAPEIKPATIIKFSVLDKFKQYSFPISAQ